jgi:hypothetical protein
VVSVVDLGKLVRGYGLALSSKAVLLITYDWFLSEIDPK